MNDDVQVLLILCLVFAFLTMVKGRGMSRRQRQLQDTLTQLQTSQSAPAVLPGASNEQVERLEARVRVLERIVTDKGYDLAHQIEALRDQRAAADQLDARETEKSL
jgi:hypothetical protein